MHLKAWWSMSFPEGSFHAWHIYHRVRDTRTLLGWHILAVLEELFLEDLASVEMTTLALPSITLVLICGGKFLVVCSLWWFWLTVTSNFGIIMAMMLFFLGTYLFGSEMIAAARSKGEVLVFRKTYLKHRRQPSSDKETANTPRIVVAENTTTGSEKLPAIHKQTDIFQWKDVCYEIQIKNETRRILDQVDGWVKPGTLTALMVSLSLYFSDNKI